MRVLHFLPAYKPAWQYGGPVRSTSKLCESLAMQGHHVSVATTNANGRALLQVPADRIVDVHGVSVRYFKRTPWLPYLDSISLRKTIRSLVEDADIVHMSAIWQPLSLAVSEASRQSQKPYICSLRGSINPWSWKNLQLKHKIFWHLFESAQLSRATALHATCTMERDEAIEIGVGKDQKWIVVANPVDSSEFCRDERLAHQFRELFHIPPEKKIILYFGRLHVKKGIDLFMQAASEVLRSSPDWIFVIIGPSERGYAGVLTRLAQELGLMSQVRFIDLVEGDTRIGALSAADLFVLTSHSENFGMSVVEAMASSVPVLISNRVGIAREIASDGAGYVIPVDVDSIRMALKQLLPDDSLRASLVLKGLKCVADHFEAKIIAKQMSDAYFELVEAKYLE